MNDAVQNPEGAEVVLSAEQAGKIYTVGQVEVEAVCEVSLNVRNGETWCIMGASGAGKSTLLNMLGGLDRPSRGRVLYRGEDLYRLPARRRNEIRGCRLGFVFQSYHLLSEMNVLQNVMLPAMAVRGFMARAQEFEQRASSLLEQVGLARRATHRPQELSGGEQQRVALARALMNQPDIVLADEPTGNLDSTTGGQILDLLFDLTREQGHTLVMVTHNEAIAHRFDQTLILRDGRLARSGESDTFA